ncbi:MAG: Crp/Fnr family transcriptional regulator [Hyphomicrobiaceae bacterium]
MLALQTSPTLSNTSDTQLVPFSEGQIGQGIAATQTRVIDRKEHVFCDGDDATQLYQVEAGHVCIYRLLPDGRRHVIDFAFPGDFIGLGAAGRHTANAQATERTRLRCLPISMLRKAMCDDPRLGLAVYEATSRELASTRGLLLSISHRSAQERVAGFLLALSHRNARRGEDADSIVLPMTRADIGDYLGLTIETVSRIFGRFRECGMIDVDQCILVTIKNRQALIEIAEGTTN